MPTHFIRFNSAPAFLLLLITAASAAAQSQAPSSSRTPDSRRKSAGELTDVGEQPFDKLELFGFFADGPMNSYASQVIQARGADFTPDAAFIAAFPYPGFQQILRNTKPRMARTPSPDRDAAFQLLRKAWDAKQGRQYAAASEYFQQALQLAPNSASLHLAYASTLMLSQNYPAAEAQARQSSKLWPENAEVHGMLALALTAQKQFAQADSESREALRIFPQHHSAMFTLGLSLTHERQYKEAIPFLRAAIPFLPNLPALKKYLGISLIETGEIAEGIEQLNLYVKAAPQDAEGHYYLGVGLRQNANAEGARAEFAEAFRLEPKNAQYEAAAHPNTTRNEVDAEPGPKPEDGYISGNIYTNRFFGFSYGFPEGWVSLSPDAARGTLEIGEAIISTGDPIENDVKKAVTRNVHSLLYVMQSRSDNQRLSIKSIMVSALDLRNGPSLTPEALLESVGQRFRQSGMPIEMSEAQHEVMLGGMRFSKADFTMHTATGLHYMSQFATINKGYALLFVVTSPDLVGLREADNSLTSLRF